MSVGANESTFRAGQHLSFYSPLSINYGLHLMQQGISSSVDLFFYDFHLFSLSVLGWGEYSTTADMERGGEFYAVSLDFNYTQLQQILSEADSRIATLVRASISEDPVSPRSIELEGHVVFSVRARLGQLQSAAKEQFVPLIAQELL